MCVREWDSAVLARRNDEAVLCFSASRLGRNKTRGRPDPCCPALWPQNLLLLLPRLLSPSLLAASSTSRGTGAQEAVRPSSGHGGDGRSEGEAACRAHHAPSRALGEPASAPPRPRARPPRRGGFAFGGRPRSPPLAVRRQPQGRRGPRGRDRGAPRQARGPPARRRRPPPRAPAKHAPAPASAEGAGDHGAATCAGAAAAASEGRGGQAVEAAGAHAAAAGLPDVVAGGAVAVEAAQACSLLCRPDAGGDRGGHLLADGRPAAAASEEAAARRAAAARFGVPGAVADGDHRRRLQGAGPGRGVAPAGRPASWISPRARKYVAASSSQQFESLVPYGGGACRPAGRCRVRTTWPLGLVMFPV